MTMDPKQCADLARRYLEDGQGCGVNTAAVIAQAWIALGQLEYLLLQQTPVDPPPERRRRYILVSRMDGKPRTSEFATLYEAQQRLRFYDPREVAIVGRMSDDEPWKEM